MSENSNGGSSVTLSKANIVFVRAHCVGETNLLLNPMTPEVLEGLRTKKPQPKDTESAVVQVCARKLYVDEDGNMGIPTDNLFSAMVLAGREVKLGGGKTKVSTATGSKLPGFCNIVGQSLLFTNRRKGTGMVSVSKGGRDFEHEGKGTVSWIADSRRGVMASGANSIAVNISRPRITEWEFDVILRINLSVESVTQQVIADVLQAAGRTSGLGDYRPSKKGTYGIFTVESWEKVRESDVEAHTSECEMRIGLDVIETTKPDEEVERKP
ncbi:hypothetical protein COB55_03315 [Candidatus Wolfebacteria bacterium]|nr:MAG: hypothetical protein COB55_03315 [Candidatus Wolfebacteria bacterium]